jgi:hypothetical protein
MSTFFAVLAVIIVIALIIEYIEYILAIVIAIAAIAGIVALVTAIKSSSKKKKEAHLKAVSEKIREITVKYTPTNIFSERGSISAEDRRVMENHLESKMPEKLSSCKELDARIQGILSCPDASSPEEKLKYLNSQLSELDSLSAQRADITEEISAELDSASAVISKVNLVVSAYAPKKSYCNITEEHQVFEDSKACDDVADVVHNYKARIAENISLYNAAAEKLESILGAIGAENETPEKMLISLHREQEKLGELKKECSAYRKEIDGFILKIVCFDSASVKTITNALSELKASKKCTSAITNAKKFIPKDIPHDLELFKYENAPAVIFIDDFYFCIFASVILVFDKNGTFSSVLKPSALKISVKRMQTKYRFDGNTDSDSRSVKFTETKKTWVYTKKDGTPDYRYKNNPVIEFPVEVDGWEYGNITVKIGSRTAEFEVSSSAALDAFEKVKEAFSNIGSKKSVSEAIVLEEQELDAEEDVLLPPIPNYAETKNRR